MPAKKPSAADVPSLGKGPKEGAARKAARAVESRQARMKSAMSEVDATLARMRGAQSTDSNQ